MGSRREIKQCEECKNKFTVSRKHRTKRFCGYTCRKTYYQHKGRLKESVHA